jgi:coenzyme F420 biosynthesis associated uncharacterized protein
MLDDACVHVSEESGLPTAPRAELLVVDRHSWIGGNVRTMQRLFGDLDLSGAEAKLLAWEGGLFVGILARAVLAQFDPFRDQLIVVYSNLGEMADSDGLRYLLFHEVTHVAQFRAAPWIPDRIVEVGRELFAVERSGWGREMAKQFRERWPEIVRWLRDALEGKAQGSPLLDLLPEPQREAVTRLHALVTLLEGHATYVTDLIAQRELADFEALQQRIAQRRRRPPLLRLLEAIAGLDMKRQQYVLGRSFCEAVWSRGGGDALAAAWRGPEWMPTLEELRDPDRWLARVATPSSA